MSKRWIESFFLSRTPAKKINMLLMWNVKIEYKKIVMHKKRNYFFVSHKNEILFFFDTCSIFVPTWQQKYVSPWQNILNNVQNKSLALHEKQFCVETKSLMLHEKVFHVDKNNWWWWCTKKNILCSKKLLIFFLERRDISLRRVFKHNEKVAGPLIY